MAEPRRPRRGRINVHLTSAKNKFEIAWLIGGLLLGLCIALPAAAVDLKERASTLPQAVQEASPQPLNRYGEGRLNWYLWHVFNASLWASDTPWRMEQPFALQLCYARDFKAEEIVESTVEQWQKIGYNNREKIEQWSTQLNSIYPDISAGDCLVGMHLPDQGKTRFFYSGEARGEIEDPSFGPNFFAIWLGENTTRPELRAALLNLKQ